MIVMMNGEVIAIIVAVQGSRDFRSVSEILIYARHFTETCIQLAHV